MIRDPTLLPMVYLGESGVHGRGVFAAKHFEPGEVIERCPVLVLPAEQREYVDQTVLANHYFEWVDDSGALALGHGSMYNHSYEPNARYDLDTDQQLILFSALTLIQPGEEIMINYNGDPRSLEPLWFEADNWGTFA